MLVVAISLAQVRRVVACSCMNSHPQTLFCNSDFGKEISRFERNKTRVIYLRDFCTTSEIFVITFRA